MNLHLKVEKLHFEVNIKMIKYVFKMAYCILRKLHIGCVNVQYMRKILSQFAIYAQDLRKVVLLSPMRKICARLYFFSNAQYMRKICASLYFFSQCTIYAQGLRKILLLSPMRNIYTRFAQDCIYFPNAQYMRKIVFISPMHNICASFGKLYFFPQCAMYALGLCKIVRISPIGNLHKIVLISPMRNIYARFAQDCTRFAQECTSLPNVQYMHNIAGIIGRNMSHITYLL